MYRLVAGGRRLKSLAAWAVLALLATVAGCSNAEREEPDDEQVKRLILNVEASEEEFPRSFAPDSVPPDAQRLRFYDYWIKATVVTIDGESATATVQFQDPNTRSVVGEQEWTAVKIDGEWKLKTAPLP